MPIQSVWYFMCLGNFILIQLLHSPTVLQYLSINMWTLSRIFFYLSCRSIINLKCALLRVTRKGAWAVGRSCLCTFISVHAYVRVNQSIQFFTLYSYLILFLLNSFVLSKSLQLGSRIFKTIVLSERLETSSAQWSYDYFIS